MFPGQQGSVFSGAKGILVAGGTTNNINNNFIGYDYSPPVVPVFTSANAVVGVEVTGGTNSNIYFNTIRLAGSGSGTTFSSAGINITSTTPVVDIRNNIVINTMPGGGVAASATSVGLRRTAAALTGYASTSDRNVWYIGTPGTVNNVMYHDGTTAYATLAAFKAQVASREANSFTEDVQFQNIVGTNANFLKVSTSVPTVVEGGAMAISGITTDYFGTVRNATAPDIGAHEDNFLNSVLVISNVTSSPAATTQCSATARTITATLTLGTPPVTSVTLNYSFNGTAQPPVTMTLTGPNTYQGIIPAATPTNANVTWGITAIDAATTKTYVGSPYADDPMFGRSVTIASNQSNVCPGSSVNLTATPSGFTANVLITEITQNYAGTGTNSAPPSYLSFVVGTGDDMVELTNMSSFTSDISGYVLERWFSSTTAPEVSYTFPAGTTLNPGQTLVVLYGAGTNDVVNKVYYVGTPGFDIRSSGDLAGYILKSGAVIKDAVGVSGYSFAAASGVTAADWSGSIPSMSGLAGSILIANDNNTASNWAVASGTRLVSFGLINPGLSVSGFNTAWSTVPSSAFTATGLTTSSGPLAATTTFTFTITDPVTGCSISAAPLTITVNTPPAAPTTVNSTQCGFGTPGVSASGVVGNSYRWYLTSTGGSALSGQTGSTLTNYPIAGPTSFWVSQVDAVSGCESARTQVDALVNNPNAVSAGASSTTICPFVNLTLTATQTGNTNTYTYAWTSSPAAGSGIPTSVAGNPAVVQATAGGTYVYTVTATDAGAGCVTTSTVTVTVTPPPVIVSATANPTTVCSGNNVTLNAVTNTSAPGTGAIGNGTLTNSTSGYPAPYGQFYTGTRTQMMIKATELQAAGFGAGNLTSLAFDVTAGTGPIAVGSGNSLQNFTISLANATQANMSAFQTGGFTQVYTVPFYNSVAGVNTHVFSTPFFWNGTSDIVVQTCYNNDNGGCPTASTNYGSNATHKYTTTSYTSVVWRNVDGTCDVCSNTLLSGTSSNRPNMILSGIVASFGSGSYSWVWNPGNISGNNVVVTPINNTPNQVVNTYTVTATDPNSGCTNFSTVSVTVNPLPPTPVATNSTQCGTGVPTASVTTQGGTMRWYLVQNGGTPIAGETGPQLTSYSISFPTTFYVAEFDNLCESVRVPVFADVTNAQAITASYTGSPCLGSSITLSTTTAAYTSFTWTAVPSTGSGLPAPVSGSSTVVSPTASGTYVYSVTATDGVCSTVSTVSVTVTPVPSITTSTASPNPVCSGGTVTLNGATGATSTQLVTLGNGTVQTLISSQPAPYGNYWTAHHEQYLILASELTSLGLTAGPINSLAMNVAALNSQGADNYTIKLAPTNVTNLTSTFESTGFTTVYGPQLYNPVVGWNTHNFSTPFVWNGTSNIVVDLSLIWCSTCPSTACTNYSDNDIVFMSNTSFTAGSYTYNDGDCSIVTFTPASAVSTINQRPNFQINGTVNTSGPGTYTWQWGPGVIPSGNVATVSPINNTNLPVTVTYTVTATDPTSGCTSTATASTTVLPVPSAPVGTNSTQCGLGVPTASVTSNGGILSWYLTPSGGTALAGENGNQLMNYSISSTTTFYVAESDGTCEGARGMVIANVTNSNAIAAVASSPTCLGSNITLSVNQTGNTNTYTYTWTASAPGSGVTGSVPGGVNGQLVVTPTASGTYTYTVTGVDGQCTVQSTVTVTVTPLPSIGSASASPNPACAGSTVTLTALTIVPGGTPYQQGFSTLPANFSSNGTGTTPGTMNTLFTEGSSSLRITYGNSANGSYQMNSGINLVGMNSPKLEFDQIASLEGVFGVIYDLGAVEYSVNGGANWLPFPTSAYLGTGLLVTSGNYPTVGINFNGHSYTDWNTDFGVNPVPTSSHWKHEAIDLSAYTANSDFRVRFHIVADGSVLYDGWYIDDLKVTVASSSGPGTYAWQWNPGSLSGNSVTVTPTTNTTYVVTATDPTSGCTSTAAVPVTVLALPASPVATNSTQCGIGVPTASVTNPGGGNLNWYLAPTGGSPLAGETGNQLSAYSISSTTTFYVSEFDGTCESARAAVVAVVTQPDAVTVSASANPVCGNSATTLTATHIGTNNTYTYAWTASPLTGSGITGTPTGSSLTVTPTAGGTFVYSVTATDAGSNCVTVSTVSVTVTAPPSIASAVANPSQICAGGTSTLTALTGSAVPGTVPIGTATTTEFTNGPFRTGAGLSMRHQYLYTASELTAAGLTVGNLTSIGFNITSLGCGDLGNYVISIKTTTATALGTSFDPGPFTTVATIATVTPVAGMNTFAFSTPFNWNGTSNILVNICYDNTTVCGSSTVDADAPVNISSMGVQGVSGACAMTTGTTATVRPRATFGGQIGGFGAGSYNWVWNPGNMSGNQVSVTPGATTTYVVTATDPTTSCTSTASATVTVISATGGIVATANPTTICVSGTTTLAITSPVAGLSYQWQQSPSGSAGTWTNISGATTVSYDATISSSTYYRAYATCGLSSDTSASMFVEVVNPTVSNATGATRCGPGSVTVSATGTGTFSWFANSSGGTALATNTNTYTTNVSSTTTFWIEANVGTCIGANRTPVTAIVSNPPLVTITSTPGTTICAGQTLTMTASSSNPGYTYNWSLNGGTTTVFTGAVYTSVPVANETVTMTATDISGGGNNGCNFILTNAITVNSTPTVAPTATPPVICTAGGSTTLNANASGVSGGTLLNATFNTGNDGFTATTTGTNAAGIFTRGISTYFNSAGIDGTAWFEANADIGGSGSFTNTAITSSVMNAAGYTSNLTLDWDQAYEYWGSSSPPENIHVDVWNGSAWITVFTAPAATDGLYGAPVHHTANIAPYANANLQVRFVYESNWGFYMGVDNVVINAISTAPSLAWTASPSDPSLSGQTTSSSPVVSPTQTTTYTVTATNSNGCSATGTVTVTYAPVTAPVITANGPTSFCQGGSVTLNAGSGYSSYSWSDGVNVVGTSQTYVASPSATTTYTVTVSNGGSCSASATQTVTIAPLAPPTISASGTTTFCQGLSRTLDAGAGYSSYSWSNGVSVVGTSQTLVVTTSGTYTVTVTAGNGCSNSSSVTIVVNPNPTAPTVTPTGPVNLCDNGSNSPVVLTSDTTGAGAGASIAWNDIDLTSTTTFSVDNNSIDVLINSNSYAYHLSVTNGFGCSSTSNNVTVNIVPCSNQIVLNAKVFIEGYYTGGGQMDNFGSGGCLYINSVPGATPADADTVVLSLMNPSNYSVVASQKGILHTNGTVSVTYPGTVPAGNYYIRVTHRNALETWSGNPVALSGTSTYDFTTAATKAYGSNMVQVEPGIWAIYSGDISDANLTGLGLGYQDGIIEAQDYLDMENAVAIIKTGYVYEDITGDGIVEAADYLLIENAVAAIRFTVHP